MFGFKKKTRLEGPHLN